MGSEVGAGEGASEHVAVSSKAPSVAAAAPSTTNLDEGTTAIYNEVSEMKKHSV